MTTIAKTQISETTGRELADRFVTFLLTNAIPDGLFSPEVFLDLSVPLWRVQTMGTEQLLAVRVDGHPYFGRVPRTRLDLTQTGFVLEFEEEWQQDGREMYCRELMRADVNDGVIHQLSVYCTGDWDEDVIKQHREQVALIRP